MLASGEPLAVVVRKAALLDLRPGDGLTGVEEQRNQVRGDVLRASTVYPARSLGNARAKGARANHIQRGSIT